MKIKRIEIEKFSLKLETPIAISFHTLNSYDNVFVRMFADNGLIGLGEAAPFLPITGDSQEEVMARARTIKVSSLPLIETAEQFYDEFINSFPEASLRAALDFAVHDLIAKSKNVPVYRLYADVPNQVPLSITLFIKDDTDHSRQEIQSIFERYPSLKILKIKLKGQNDLARCNAIKDLVPKGVQVVLDANQGFEGSSEAIQTLSGIFKVFDDVLLVEEPCPKRDYLKLGQVSAAFPGKIFADESCCSEADLESLAGICSGINIKLQKTGGITPARRLAKLANDRGFKIMVGQMFETTLSTNAGIHFAYSTPGVVLADLDMDLELPDFCFGKVPVLSGSRIPLPLDGLGASLDADSIGQLVDLGKIQLERGTIEK